MSKLADRIKSARQNAGLTQEELAKLCGVSRATVNQWEAREPNKTLRPRNKNLKKVSDVTGVTYEWLRSFPVISEYQKPLNDEESLDFSLEKEVELKKKEEFQSTKAAIHDIYQMLIDGQLNTEQMELIKIIAKNFKAR